MKRFIAAGAVTGLLVLAGGGTAYATGVFASSAPQPAATDVYACVNINGGLDYFEFRAPIPHPCWFAGETLWAWPASVTPVVQPTATTTVTATATATSTVTASPTATSVAENATLTVATALTNDQLAVSLPIPGGYQLSSVDSVSDITGGFTAHFTTVITAPVTGKATLTFTGVIPIAGDMLSINYTVVPV